jgi:hypothetical protein
LIVNVIHIADVLSSRAVDGDTDLFWWWLKIMGVGEDGRINNFS